LGAVPVPYADSAGSLPARDLAVGWLLVVATLVAGGGEATL
jgi:hypothetical protein